MASTASRPAAPTTILLVDDEDSIQKLLAYPLERDGFRVVQARDGAEALDRFSAEDVDLVVLDLMLPKVDGLEVCRRLRAQSAVPIIMLTARGDEVDKVLGLELGADDYITKPFSIREFSSRVRALLRRAQLVPAPAPDGVIEVDGLRIDPERRTVTVRERAAQLTYLEFELLRTLAASPGRVFTRQTLLDTLWGGSDYRDPRTIDVHVRHLREKIEDDPSDPVFVFTVRGVGYRFRDRVNRLRRLSVKLGLVLFLVVAGALAIVYLAVLPQLESRLVGAKIRELERAAPTLVGPVVRAEPFDLADVASFYATSLNARVVVYDRLTRTTLAPVADSSGLSSQDVQQDAIALRAARSDLPASGRVERGGSEYAEAAIPAGQDSVVLVSAPLSDALATVALVRRSLLIAAGVSLLVSWLAGYLAAWSFTRRIRRLEGAAERIAGGDFEEPVTDGGRDEVGQLAHAFDRMRRRLAQLDHARREFIANASHELRTPLFSLGGFLELITDEELDDRTRRDFLEEMREQVARLTRLATDLLDLSRLDAGQLAVERVEIDLGVTVRTVADEFRVLAEAESHDLVVAPDGPAPAWGDEQRVLQIARILVENALRHTPAGTRVRVTAGADAERAWLEVSDDGPGVSPAEREHLFDRFYRGDGGKASGSGLGLAIGSELAGRMGGGIKVRSQPGSTAFHLWLPVAPFSRDVPDERLAAVKTPAA